MRRTARVTLRLAWRNLWRNHRRTLIMLAAVVVGVWAMIFMTALTRGMVDDMVWQAIRSLPGDVQVHAPGFQADPSVGKVIPPPDARLLAVLDRPPVVRWASRVRVPAVVSSERDTRGVTLIGIDPQAERGLSFVADDVDQGRFLRSPQDDGIVLGRKLVARLETGLGKRIVIMTQNPANQMVDRGFRIVGIFHTTMEAQEDAYAFVGRETLQRLLGIGPAISEIAVLGPSYRDVAGLRQRVAAAAGAGRVVESWRTLDPYSSSMLDMMDGFILIWIVVVFLALGFGLVNTLVMAVFERVREIGLMLALGMTPGSILAQVVLESALLLSLGLLAGDLIAWATILPLRGGIDLSIVGKGMEFWGSGSVLHPALRWQDVLLANLVVLVLGFLASLSPAWRASRYEPVIAITKV